MRTSLALALPFLLSTVALVACASAPADDGTSTDESAIRTPRPGDIVGPIRSGETRGPIAVPGVAPGSSDLPYRAFTVELQAGETVDAWVRSPNGEPFTVLADATYANIDSAFATRETRDVFGNVVTPAVPDAHLVATARTSGKHYLMFRDARAVAADFTVSLTVLPAPPPPPPPPPPPQPGDACSTPDEVARTTCGVCGMREAVCIQDPDGPSRTWSNYSACHGELPGGCVPGETREEACGTCGTRTVVCSQWCAWAAETCVEPAGGCP